jgi:alkylation response protein AidB-like acyl-CoA dehydrogenase
MLRAKPDDIDIRDVTSTSVATPGDAQGAVAGISALAREWAGARPERQRRRELNPADFEAIRQAGFHLACLPTEEGGFWENRARSTALICDLLRILASADSSVALVCAMHPAVLVATRWLDRATAPDRYRSEWEEQRTWAFGSVRAGAWWGTIQSEPGTGGDLRKTRAIARSVSGLEYHLSGDKHFGTGSGIASYMITTGLPEGQAEPDVFFMDMRGIAWDGSSGVRLLAPWDGQGMTATQSHSMRFEDFPMRRLAWPSTSRRSASEGVGGAFFAAVVVGIVETAFETARSYIASRRSKLGAYEQVEWSRAGVDAWLVQQAYAGLLRAVEVEDDLQRTGRLAKLAIAELAESTLRRICRVVGGGSYSRQSPFGYWFEDVRALGFLRPPWALAHESLVELDRDAGLSNGLAAPYQERTAAPS